MSVRFAPASTMGSATVTALADTLVDLGHEVSVLTARDRHYEGTLNTRVPPASVWPTPVPMHRIMRSVDQVSVGAARVAEPRPGLFAPLLRLLRRIGRALLIPDAYVTWAVPAIVRSLRRVRRLRPHIVISAGPPHSGIIVGAILAHSVDAEHVVYFRDLWLDNPYGSDARLRRLQQRIEAIIVRRARCVLTPTDGARVTLAERYPAADVRVFRSYPRREEILGAASATDPVAEATKFRIVHAGSLYRGLRDPVPLLRELVEAWPAVTPIAVDFYGDAPSIPDDLLIRLGQGVSVQAHGRVPREDALRATNSAGVGLVLTWPDEPDGHSVPGKVYELAMLGVPTLVFGRYSEEIDRVLDEMDTPHCVTASPERAVTFLTAIASEPIARRPATTDPQREQVRLLIEQVARSDRAQ